MHVFHELLQWYLNNGFHELLQWYLNNGSHELLQWYLNNGLHGLNKVIEGTLSIGFTKKCHWHDMMNGFYDTLLSIGYIWSLSAVLTQERLAPPPPPPMWTNSATTAAAAVHPELCRARILSFSREWRILATTTCESQETVLPTGHYDWVSGCRKVAMNGFHEAVLPKGYCGWASRNSVAE